MGFIRPPSRAGLAPRLPPTPHPFENIGCLVPGRPHAGQDHEPWAPGNLIGLNLAGLAHEASGKGDGPRSLEFRDVPLDELVQDEQGSKVHGRKLLILSLFPPCAAPQSLPHRGLLSPLMGTQGRAYPQVCRTRRGERSRRTIGPAVPAPGLLSVPVSLIFAVVPSASARPRSRPRPRPCMRGSSATRICRCLLGPVGHPGRDPSARPETSTDRVPGACRR